METNFPPPGGQETKPKRRMTARAEQAMADKDRTIRDAGKILPNAPINGADLAELWKIGSEDAFGVSVKVLRQVPGEHESRVELLTSCPLAEYDIQRIAGRYGPGVYFLRGTGKWIKAVTKFRVAEDMARDGGFGRVPEPQVPRASEMLALETVNRVGQGAAVEPIQLLAAVEQIVERVVANRIPAQPAAPAAPVAGIQSQFDGLLQILKMSDMLEERALRTVERRLGVTPEAEKPELTTGQILLQLLPQGLEIFSKMIEGRNAHPSYPTPPPPKVVNPPTTPAAPAPAAAPEPLKGTAVNLTPEELETVKACSMMLRPMAPAVGQLMQKPNTDEELAEEIGGYIPPNLYESLCKLSKLTDAKGPEVLGMIHPALGTPRCASVLRVMRSAIEATDE